MVVREMPHLFIHNLPAFELFSDLITVTTPLYSTAQGNSNRESSRTSPFGSIVGINDAKKQGANGAVEKKTIFVFAIGPIGSIPQSKTRMYSVGAL
jgi:hypothetical protein